MCEREATVIGKPHGACLEPPTQPAMYKHQPLNRSLDEIRLLKLRKEEHGPVHCDVEVFPLEQAPEYIALSYRWGPPSPSHDIFIGEQGLKIRDILHACLLELREDVDAWLWIDQICIAQADTAERNHQVGMMSRIYSDATSVIVWLGDVPLAPSGEVDRFNNQDLDTASIIVLFENDYFRRLWIIQEILLAKSVKLHLNGKRCVGWKRLLAVWSRAVRKPPLLGRTPHGLVGLLGHARERWGLSPQLTWTDCIARFSENTCEDARDKVYGMMGVVKEEDRFTVDYNKSVLEVFLSVISTFKHPLRPKPRKILRNRLYLLGYEMGIEMSLMQDLQRLVYERLKKSSREAVSPVKFKKADHEEETDYWWYECNGERFCYPRPPSASSVVHSKHTSGVPGRTVQHFLRIFAQDSRISPLIRIRNWGSRDMSAEPTALSQVQHSVRGLSLRIRVDGVLCRAFFYILHALSTWLRQPACIKEGTCRGTRWCDSDVGQEGYRKVRTSTCVMPK